MFCFVFYIDVIVGNKTLFSNIKKNIKTESYADFGDDMDLENPKFLKLSETFDECPKDPLKNNPMNILKAIETQLDNLPSKKTPTRKKIIELLIPCLIRKIFGPKLNTYRKEIGDLGYRHLYKELIILAGRRTGKTYTCQEVAVSALLCIPNYLIIVYAQNLLGSTLFIEGLTPILFSTEVSKHFKVDLTKYKIKLTNNLNVTDVRSIECLPKTVCFFILKYVCLIVRLFVFKNSK